MGQQLPHRYLLLPELTKGWKILTYWILQAYTTSFDQVRFTLGTKSPDAPVVKIPAGKPAPPPKPAAKPKPFSKR
mgnify:CR=1 FL=1